ncbi:MAG: thioredoxin family protein, partial [Magnetococcales bacterium]|nr:thioredoxin family protein [Magnetococcales bacterium]
IVFVSHECIPCQRLGKNLRWFQDKWGDLAHLVKVDVRKHMRIAMDFNIRGVPTMVIYRNRKRLMVVSGERSKGELKKLFKNVQIAHEPTTVKRSFLSSLLG